MSVIGKLVFQGPNTSPEGYLKTLQLQLTFWMEPTGMAGPNAPHYHIFTSSKGGGSAQIGAAWKKAFQKPGKPQTEFFSLTFDDPSFPQALNVAAFPNKDGGYDISYRRRQAE